MFGKWKQDFLTDLPAILQLNLPNIPSSSKFFFQFSLYITAWYARTLRQTQVYLFLATGGHLDFFDKPRRLEIQKGVGYRK